MRIKNNAVVNFDIIKNLRNIKKNEKKSFKSETIKVFDKEIIIRNYNN